MSEPNYASTTSFKKVTYVDANGCKYSMSGDSKSWRNNNPGNLKYGPFAKANGAIGQDSEGYAIFPNYATGEQAMRELLLNSYGGQNITTAIPRYAGLSDAKNAEYIAFLVANGVDPNQLIGSMSIEQFDNLINQMIRQEGFRIGTTSSYYCPNGSYKTVPTPGAPAPAYQNHSPPLRPEESPTRFMTR